MIAFLLHLWAAVAVADERTVERPDGDAVVAVVEVEAPVAHEVGAPALADEDDGDDALGRVSEVLRSTTVVDTLTRVEAYSYDDLNNLRTLTSTSLGQWSYAVRQFSEVGTRTNGAGTDEDDRWDASGRLTSWKTTGPHCFPGPTQRAPPETPPPRARG